MLIETKFNFVKYRILLNFRAFIERIIHEAILDSVYTINKYNEQSMVFVRWILDISKLVHKKLQSIFL